MRCGDLAGVVPAAASAGARGDRRPVHPIAARQRSAQVDAGSIVHVPGSDTAAIGVDGTARGGVLVALADRFGLPIHAIGVGEQIDDLQAFDPADFARALTGAEN